MRCLSCQCQSFQSRSETSAQNPLPALSKRLSLPTIAAAGDAIIELDGTDPNGTYRLWSTSSGWDSNRPALTPRQGGRALDITGRRASSTINLNDWEFEFIATAGTGIGSPLGVRRLLLIIEITTGLLLVGSVLVGGDRRARRDAERQRREALLAAALQGTPGWTAIVDESDRVLIANNGPNGVEAGRLLASVPIWRDDPIALTSVARLIDTARTGSAASTQYVATDDAGTMRIIDIEARPLPDPDLVYLQCLDVTDERSRAMRTAQSERMETIGVVDGRDAIVIVMQRVHQNDLVGHVLEKNASDWTVLALPAIAEDDHIVQLDARTAASGHQSDESEGKGCVFDHPKISKKYK